MNIHNFIFNKNKLYANKISNTNKSIPLSNLLQTKIGNIINETDTMQDILNKKQKGMILRMAFDDMKQDVVPGTFIHNGMYTPNPLYILQPNGEAINSTTVLIASYSDNMFNNLLPGNKITDTDSYIIENNAFYPHDSNSTDQRMNQYAKTLDNKVFNSASEKNCAYGRKFGGEPKELGWGPGPQTILCDNATILNTCCIGDINDCKNNLNKSVVPALNCNSGNVANGKGIHQTWDINEFNPMFSKNQLYGVQYTINDKNINKEDNTFGKWMPKIIEAQSKENKISWTDDATYKKNILNTPIIQYSKTFDKPGFIPYWIQYGNNNNNLISMFDNIKYERIQDGPNPLQNKLDYIIPWTDDLLTLMHMNNSLYEYYFNHNMLKTNFDLDLWWGWTEVPVKSIEPDMSIWTNEIVNNLNHYTLIIYIQDNSIKSNDKNLKKTLQLYNSSWFKEGGARENMNIIFSKKYNTNILTNFNKCFKNDDNTSNIHWNNITTKIIQYIDNLLNKTNNFGSCSVVFMKQNLVKINNTYIYQKQLFDVDPNSVANELVIGTLKYNNNDLKIKFKWRNINNHERFIFEL